MKPSPPNLDPSAPLRCFVRRAYQDLRILGGTRWMRDVAVANGMYRLRQDGSTSRWVRPVNSALFIDDPDQYATTACECLRLLGRLRRGGADPGCRERLLEGLCSGGDEVGRTSLDRFLYTTVQCTGCVFDIENPNAQRTFGLLYQSFVHAVVRYLGFSTSALNILVPVGYWDTRVRPYPEVRTSITRVEVDMVVGPVGQAVRTTAYSVWPEDSFATVKSSTKDRISQVFTDAIDIQRLSVWRIAKYMLFIHNDVQRTSDTGISWTFLPTNFAEGSRSFPLSGMYFSDMPGNVMAAKSSQEEWARLCRYLSEFLIRDVWL